MSISLLPGGSIRVTVPYMTPLFYAKSVFKNNSDIVQKLFLQREKKMNLLKEEHGLHENLFKVHTKKEIDQYKKEAHIFVTNTLKKIQTPFETPYKKVSIKNTKSRWGSCSSSGTIAFHYKILFLPEDLVHYLLVHELSHLQEMNHSASFWKHVGSVCENFEEKRKKLRSIPCVV